MLTKLKFEESGDSHREESGREYENINYGGDDDMEELFLKSKKSSTVNKKNEICSNCLKQFEGNIIFICRTCESRGWTF